MLRLTDGARGVMITSADLRAYSKSILQLNMLLPLQAAPEIKRGEKNDISTAFTN